MRNSSRDYFKNFDVEKFCTKIDPSQQSSVGEETESSCPSRVLTNDLRPPVNCPSPMVPPTFLKTNSSSPRLTPEFVFRSDRVTTELHSQVREGKVERVLELVEDPGPAINYRDQEGETPLHVAVREGHLRLTQILLHHGADPNMTDSHLRTSLHYVGLYGDLSIMEVLLQYNLDYSAKECILTLTGKFLLISKYLQDDEGRTILHYLADKKDGLATARKFLERLSSVREKDKLFSVRNLVSLTDNQGQSCVHLACQAGSRDFLALLLQHNPELDGANTAGMTGLHLSVVSREAGAGCLSSLLQAGADTSRTDGRGRTPLLLAVAETHGEAVSCLVEAGADTNTTDCEGNVM